MAKFVIDAALDAMLAYLRDPERLRNLLLGRTFLDGFSRVNRNASVTARRHGDSERYQLSRLCIEVGGFGTCAAGHHVRIHRVGRKLFHFTDAHEQILLITVPIEHDLIPFPQNVFRLASPNPMTVLRDLLLETPCGSYFVGWRPGY